MRCLFLLAMFFSSCLHSSPYIDGDFDHDGVKDRYEIVIEKNMKLNLHLSSINNARVYFWDYLNSPDDGFTQLYKYGDRNYIVYYYSDFRDNSEYVEDIYSWNQEKKELVLYLTAEVRRESDSVIINTKVAKCCTIAGDKESQPIYLNSSDTAKFSEDLVNAAYLKMKGNDNTGSGEHLLIDEEISIIISNYNVKNKDKYNFIAAYYKSKGDKITWKKINDVIGE